MRTCCRCCAALKGFPVSSGRRSALLNSSGVGVIVRPPAGHTFTCCTSCAARLWHDLCHHGHPLQAYGRASELQPGRLLPRVQAGHIQTALGDTAAAEASFGAALQLDAGHPAALLGLGAALLAAARSAAAQGAPGGVWGCGFIFTPAEDCRSVGCSCQPMGVDTSIRTLQAWRRGRWRGRQMLLRAARLATATLRPPGSWRATHSCSTTAWRRPPHGARPPKTGGRSRSLASEHEC